jgi:hypothetical protein
VSRNEYYLPYYWKYSHLTRFLTVAPLLLSTAQGFHHTRPSSPLLIGFELQDLHQDKKGEQKRLRFAFLLLKTRISHEHSHHLSWCITETAAPPTLFSRILCSQIEAAESETRMKKRCVAMMVVFYFIIII